MMMLKRSSQNVSIIFSKTCTKSVVKDRQIRSFSLLWAASSRTSGRTAAESCPIVQKSRSHFSNFSATALLHAHTKSVRFLSDTQHRACREGFPHSVGAFNNIIIHTQELRDELRLKDIFTVILRESLEHWRRHCHNGVWLHVAIEHAHIIELARDLGFCLHHTSNDTIVMNCWLNHDVASRIPPYASHQVGVCGCVIRQDTNEILVTKDHHKLPLWKFPGGLSDHAEDIATTAVREVKEETGIEAEFNAILGFRQQHHQPNSFDRSDLYFICRLEAKTHEISMCSHEVLDCRWMGIKQLANSAETTPLSRRMAGLLIEGLHNGFKSVDIGMEQFDAVYPGLTYKLFHRPLHKPVRASTPHADGPLESMANGYA